MEPNHKPPSLKMVRFAPTVGPSHSLFHPQGDSTDADTKPEAPKDPDEDAKGRKLPSIAWTTYHNGQKSASGIERWPSHALSQPRNCGSVPWSLRAMQKRLRTGARYLYFVSSKIRYGRYRFRCRAVQPHQASEVWRTSMGIARTKTPLSKPFCTPRGFATAPALIGVGLLQFPRCRHRRFSTT